MLRCVGQARCRQFLLHEIPLLMDIAIKCHRLGRMVTQTGELKKIGQ